jgi:hypothetical protein
MHARLHCSIASAGGLFLDGAMNLNWKKVDMETNHSTTRIRTSL